MLKLPKVFELALKAC